MKSIIPIMILLFCTQVLAQESNTSRLGLRPSVQLSSTYLGTNLALELYQKDHLIYAGPKLQLTNSLSFGQNPLGLDVGYGYNLLKSDLFNMYMVVDVQWISWDPPASKATHYIDVTLNYRLGWNLGRSWMISQSLGYGILMKRFYRNDLAKYDMDRGFSGLLSFGLTYLMPIKKEPDTLE